MTIEQRIGRWIRPEIDRLTPYHVPDARGMTKLDAMENPYRWPTELRTAWLECLASTALNRYPDASALDLRARIFEWCGAPDGSEIILGNGSDELIQILALSLGGPGRTILAPEPTFVMYRTIAQFTGTAYIGVAAGEALTPGKDALLRAIDKHNPCCVFLAHPNNPTGAEADPETVQAVVAATDGLVVIDEAYHVFCRDSFVNLLESADNLVVMRTFSKLGLAGLRLGFLIGPRLWLDVFDRVRLPYNINSLTQASVLFALEHIDWFQDKASQICNQRAVLLQALADLPGVTVYPSSANFLLFKVNQGQGEHVFRRLKEEKVLIKNLHGTHPGLLDCLRVTVGTPEQNNVFLDALEKILK